MWRAMLVVLCLWLPPPAFAGPFRIEVFDNIDQSCLADVVRSAANGLNQIGATGTATVGYYDDLALLLSRGGSSEERARDIVNAIERVRSHAHAIPGLRYTNEVLSKFAEQKILFVCSMSSDSNLTERGANTLAFGNNMPYVVAIVPCAAPADKDQWALSFIGVFAGVASQQLVVEWLYSAYHMERWKKGTGGELYRKFGQTYDGSFPVQGSEELTAFMLFWMSMGQNLVSQNVFTFFHPQSAERNAAALLNGSLPRLLRELPRPDLVQGIITELGLTEQNYFSTAADLYTQMTDVILEFRRLNAQRN